METVKELPHRLPEKDRSSWHLWIDTPFTEERRAFLSPVIKDSHKMKVEKVPKKTLFERPLTVFTIFGCLFVQKIQKNIVSAYFFETQY